MKSIYKYLDTRLFLIGLLLLPFWAVVSCQSDDDDAIPVIHYVRVTDPAKADSTFTDVNPGTMIVVVGEHLNGTQKVFINDQEVSFNGNYVTSTSIILTIPAELELTGANSELKGEIRVETDHGVAVYSMHVLSPAPYITRIAAIYPIEAGDELTLIGGNFYEIQSVYFSTERPSDDGERPATIQEIADYEVTNNYGRITLTVPANVIEEGYLVVECYTSSAVIEFTTTIPAPVLTGISSTMPVVGSRVTITGQNFIQVSNINVNGEFDIPAAGITVSDEFDELSFILPQAPTHSGKISVTTGGGTGEVPGVFYPIENVILNYDGIGSFSWGGHASIIQADGSAAPFVSTGNCCGIAGAFPIGDRWWWGQSVNTLQWPAFSIISAETAISDLELQFECFVGELPVGPVLQIAMSANWDHTVSGYIPVNAFTGEAETGQWMQCSVPLSSVIAESTYQEYLNRQPDVDGNGPTTFSIYITNPTGNEDVNVAVYFDNFRVVRK